MTDDRGDRVFKALSLHDAEPPRDPSTNILDALDMDGVGEIDIVFERLPSRPRPATFD